MMEILDIAGVVASILGLVVTGFTFRAAANARDAAIQAKQAVLRSNAAADFEALTRVASEFLDKVQNDHVAESSMRGRDLIGGIAVARKKWDQFLDKPGRIAIEETTVQIRIAVQVLASGYNPEDPKHKKRLCEIAGVLLHTLGSEAGKISSTPIGE